MNSERRRLPLALLLSLLIHGLLLTLTFGGQGLGLPGFGFPWQERRTEAPELRLVFVPAPVAEPADTPAAEPPQREALEPPIPAPAPTAPVSKAPIRRPTTAAIVPKTKSDSGINPTGDAATSAPPANTPMPEDRPGATAPPSVAAPPVIPLARSDEPTWVVPATPTTVVAPAPSASTSETATPSQDAGDAAGARIDQEAQARAVELARLDRARQEAQRQAEQLESNRVEAERQEAERQAAARQETVRQEAARQEPQRQEAQRQTTERQEAEQQAAARQEAARQEAARQEAARQEAARQEAARQEAARQEAARQEAARQEAARQEAARQEAARAGLAQEAEARREAARRAMGRQLDEEAARREAASAAARASPSSYSGRRGRLFGRADPNAELIAYAEAWERKIQLNMTFEMVREAAKQPHTDPMVTVAIRSDGSVESVTFVRSSGAAAIDDAIRAIVHSQEHYQAFPPALAREFDVIEIRRTWHFDMAIRLY
jgi:Histone H1-like nucleoprotein HC2/TonB C terminal